MADSTQFAALEWVVDEIGETLQLAAQALEAYVENPVDGTQIRFCLTYLHQVTGTLRMVELSSSVHFSEEMESLAQAIMDGQLRNEKEAQNTLMQAMLKLPVYLEQIQAQRMENGALLLSLINDMRAARGESLLSQSAVFTPDLSAAKKLSGKLVPLVKDAKKFVAAIIKLRKMYQYAVVQVVRGVDVEDNLKYLAKVSQRLLQLTSGTPRRSLWEITNTLIAGLEQGGIELTVAVKDLLRQLDAEIKVLGDKGPRALKAFTDDELLGSLLYYIAHAPDEIEGVPALKEKYDLERAVEQAEAPVEELAITDQDTVRSVVEALKTELDFVKQALEETLEMGVEDALQRLVDTQPVFKRVEDTMSVLGINSLCSKIADQGGVVSRLIDGAEPFQQDTLLGVASQLIAIESTLEQLARGEKTAVTQEDMGRSLQLGDAQKVVIEQCRTGLEQAKDAIVEYIAAQWDEEHLTGVPGLLDGIRGSLEMVPLPRPAAILGSCSRYVQDSLLGATQAPEWEALDTLADAITSAEYYLECISSTSENGDDALLDMAEKSLVQLGVAPANVKIQPVAVEAPEVTASEPEDVESESPPEILGEGPGSSELAIEDISSASNEEGDTLAEASEDMLVEAEIEPGLPEAIVEVETESEADVEAASQPEGSLAQTEETVGDDAVDDSSESVAVVEDVTLEKEEPESDIDDEIDEEILEIFVEEAGEVLEAIDEFFPQWAEDFNNIDALGEFRRAFHTLKGSGRMVNANDIGELAWSVENMLNRIIDNTVETSKLQVEFISKVRQILPDMVAAFEARKPHPHKVLAAALEEAGHALGKGESPDLPEVNLSKVEPQEEIASGYDENIAEESTSDSVLPDVVESDASDVQDEDEDDEQVILWGIFAGEARGHLDLVNEFVDAMEAARPLYEPPGEGMQRALHTLKGSAHMADVTPVAELATPWEHFMKEMRSYLVPVDDDILQLIKDGVTYTEEVLQQIDEGRPLEITKLDQFLARVAEQKEHTVGHLIRQKEAREELKVDPQLLEIFMAEEMSVLLDADQHLANWRENPEDVSGLERMKNELEVLHNGASKAGQEDMAALAGDLEAVHQHLVNHPGEELGEEYICALEQGHNFLLDMIDAMAAGQNTPVLPEEISQLLHAAGASPEQDEVAAEVGEYYLPSENVVVTAPEVVESIEDIIDSDFADIVEVNETEGHELLDDVEFELVDELEEVLPSLGSSVEEQARDIQVDELSGEEQSTPLSVEVEPEEAPLVSVSEEYDEETLEIFLEEADELLEEIEQSLNDWDDNPDSSEPLEELKRSLHTFKGGARMAGITPIGDLAHDFETYLIERASKENCRPRAHRYQDQLFNAVSAVRSGQPVVISEFATGASDAPVTIDVQPEQEDVISTTPETVVEVEDAPVIVAPSSSSKDDVDPEIIEIFIEEADELLEEIDEAMNDWQAAPDNLEPGEELKRALHTFKGGARLCSLMALGEVAHNFETFLIEAQNQGRSADTLFDEMHSYHDQLLNMVERAKDVVANEDYDSLDDLMAGVIAEDISVPAEPEATSDQDEVEQESSHGEEPTAGTSDDVRGEVLPFKPKQAPAIPDFQGVGDAQPAAPSPQGPGAPGFTGGMQAQARKSGPQEVVKISAELLEELVNLAGETSIQRGRVEEQMSDFVFSLDEMESTISRLQDQLRRLDMETQAQVQFREEQIADNAVEFDPLEMDRYSQLQQLSRSLFEAASDLSDLKSTMSNKARDTETLLLQQSRVNTDLQEGLMRSRMVPFSRMVPRLRRIVRQTSNEVGKNVELLLENVDGEMDRSVLERMVPPLEHMLRNAIDHGLESPEERMSAGKQDVGRILISMTREGGDIMLRVADDGRGINLEKVREKAIANGLMAKESALSDQEVMQFILHAGFSTAETVSQISGRGVGMDVVYSEIKQLGGNVSINSVWGQGTEFLIRLPFTVSVNRALMIEIGADHYAVPLNTIEGIVRVSPYELEHYYQNPDDSFEYAGQKYDLRYLGTLLHSTARPKLEGRSLPLPVVLVRSADYSVALQVDQLMGSREIVVKSLGSQFAAVHGLSGATVLGDGSVVVILDLLGLIRSESKLIGTNSNVIELRAATLELADESEDEISAQKVMVVDDSVTVRKVTGRFLEREGFDVITATDGRDAMHQLQDNLPDVMLLDIEMPRMDGFEVVAEIRSSQRLKHIPIIMITSRTGEKHRDRALSLGANRYMGKPYQEELLLATIRELLEEKVDAK